MITIIDLGLGNIGSIHNMLGRLGEKATVASSLSEISMATRLILPGVGAFDYAMSELQGNGMRDLLRVKVLEQKVPILGICLGMQLLANISEEGRLEGLGYIPGRAVKFKFDASYNLKVPHMGWNTIQVVDDSPLFAGFEQNPRFYFAHSYYVVCDEASDVAAISDYGITFSSSVRRDNIYGVQFHPEKSHKFGMRLLSNFARNT